VIIADDIDGKVGDSQFLIHIDLISNTRSETRSEPFRVRKVMSQGKVI